MKLTDAQKQVLRDERSRAEARALRDDASSEKRVLAGIRKGRQLAINRDGTAQTRASDA